MAASLPKLRWLLFGVLAVGGWTMMQDSPKPASEKRVEQRQVEKSKIVARRTVSTDRPVARAQPPVPAKRPGKAVAQQPSSEVITSSVPRPRVPIGAETAEQSLTTSRVRMRKEAATTAGIVAMLKSGERVDVLSRQGKWAKVSAGNRTGWVHGDYLSPAAAPTGKMAGSDEAQSSQRQSFFQKVSTETRSRLSGKLPARAPQSGDCECPFDLMLNGKQCGEYSSYGRGTVAREQCYL